VPCGACIEEEQDECSDQVDALQKRAADLKNSFDQARQETSEQVKARIDQTKADIATRPGRLTRRSSLSLTP
jgi:peptidoglycan hydrolase CwlO-like protein